MTASTPHAADHSSDDAPPIFVGEGVVPVEAFQLQPWTMDRLAGVVLLLAAGAFVLSIADSLGGYLFAGAVLCLPVIALSTRLLPELAYARTRRAGHAFENRFEIGESGIRQIGRMVTGEPFDRHYDWFMFEHHDAQPHRLIVWLRVPSAHARGRPEVVLIPAALFPGRFDELVAYVRERVPIRVAAPAPAPDPHARTKTLVLWVVLVALMFALYRWSGAD